jgi:hypothetical protein
MVSGVILSKAQHGRRVLIAGAFLLLFVLTYLSLLLGSRYIETIIVSEDGVYQNLSALALLTASVLCVLAFRSSRVAGRRRVTVLRISYLVLAAVFFVGAGEEISWGQHLFNFGTPEQVGEVNAQGETNVHNIGVVRESTITPARLFFAFAAIFLFVIPVVSALHEATGRRLRGLVPVVPLFVGLLFLANFALSKVATVLSSAQTRQPIKEIQETNYALLLALASFYVFAYVREHRVERAAEAALLEPLQTTGSARAPSR